MLHITNGDLAAARIAEAAPGGDVLPWRDVLHEGPVPAGLGDAELREVRAGFLAAPGWSEEAEVLRSLEERDARLEAAAGNEEIVLWFEPDLYDQLQLLQVLDRIARLESGAAPVTAVEPVEAIGDLEVARVRELFAGRAPLPAGALDLARDAWARFRDPDPTRLEALAAPAPPPALPFLPAALRRHLEELPSLRDGLSRSERQALEVLRAGSLAARDLFLAAHHGRERRVFLGDTVFYSYLDRLASGARPLVTVSMRPARPDAVVELTDDGKAVLEGTADWIDLGGPDRWLGGVHCSAREDRWRWDPAPGRVTRRAGG
jgi:hypothetical protein